MLGDDDEVVTRTLTQRRSKLSLSEVAVGHAEALHSTVVLQHEQFVNLHPDSPLKGRREGDFAHVKTSLSSPPATVVVHQLVNVDDRWLLAALAFEAVWIP